MEWIEEAGGSAAMTRQNSDTGSERARIKALISDRVQGVGFRSYARRYANAFGLSGWVTNLYDGRVEVVAEGEKAKILQYIRLLEEGSTWSRVDSISVDWRQYKGDLTSFSIK
jgi:acylphosphatase